MKRIELKTLLTLLFLITNLIIYGQQLSQGGMGLFDGHSDIGSPGIEGKLKYNPDNQTYQLTGSGENIWFTNDEFYFVWKRLKGDLLIRANMEFNEDGNHGHRKMGLIIRNSSFFKCTDCKTGFR